MPQAPNVDGLPVWLQVFVSVAFVLSTIWVALRGYKRTLEREPPGAAQTLVAAFPDMTTFRQLTDQCRILSQYVDSLSAELREHTHFMRDEIEVQREMCMRMRELKEEIIRSDRQRFRDFPGT